MFIRNHWSVLGQGLIFKSQLAQKRKNGDYYIGTDGSNNEWLVKRHSLLVQVFDDDKGEVIDQLLDFGTAKANHAKFFFKLLIQPCRILMYDGKIVLMLDRATQL